ncbi:MAG: proprotein convertase P-domain-containing protein [Pseudomonadota bacterium]
MRFERSLLAFFGALVMAVGCGDGASDEFAANPFLEDQANASKEDTHYLNPDGIEVEVDLEGDVDAPAYRKAEAPAMLGQFALTTLAKRGDFYLESLAEDATSRDRVEWRVDGNWITAAEAEGLSPDLLTHFRIRGVNAVLLHGAMGDAAEGKLYLARVPKKPFSIMADAGDACADKDGHMSLSQSIYWYMWNPDRSQCATELQQDLAITLTKMLPSGKITYPEWDKLVADGKITTVILYGLIGDEMSEYDTGMVSLREMSAWLLDGGFKEATAPLGVRFTRAVAGVTVEIDLYSPKEFSGLGDHAHFGNFQKALSEHEIVVYDGHSMLGASDFWSRPDYPDFYQIYLYGGCLGYEYYVRPILNGKGGWDTLDILSSVIEVSATANEYAGPFLSKMLWAIEHDYNVSWKDILVAVRKRVGDSTFGVSGVRENCFSPAGSLCLAEDPTPGAGARYEKAAGLTIPDNDPVGVSSVMEVTDDLAAASLTLELDVTHTFSGDLRITLSHGGAEAVVWDQAGGSTPDLHQSFVLDAFAGADIQGEWTLKVVDAWEDDVGTLDAWALVVVPE